MRLGDGVGISIVDVDEISQYIRDRFDSDPLLADVWVRGEVSNARRSPPGHWYFVLKSDSAQLRCVLFRGDSALVSHLPQDGEAVLSHGRISSYPAFGQYQLYVDQILPEGDGLLHLQFEALYRKLEGEGIFDDSRKRSLPAFPRKIAVVTSPTGSVWHDIQDVLRRRYPLGELIVSPTLVQGDSAPASIVSAIQAVVEDGQAEVLIIARGGGSIEDLWAFNDERVVRAVYRCPIPVVSAIGHETDVTLTDLAADLRAPTPSAAAELVAPHIREYQQHLASQGEAFSTSISRLLGTLRYDLIHLHQRLTRHDPHWLLQQERMRLDQLGDSLGRAVKLHLYRENSRVNGLKDQLRLLDPVQLLGRGYAVVTDGDSGKRVRGVGDLTTGATVRLDFRDGASRATIDAVRRRDEKEVDND
jgi:exodeoxyribonuclease VII large subunit